MNFKTFVAPVVLAASLLMGGQAEAQTKWDHCDTFGAVSICATAGFEGDRIVLNTNGAHLDLQVKCVVTEDYLEAHWEVTKENGDLLTNDEISEFSLKYCEGRTGIETVDEAN